LASVSRSPLAPRIYPAGRAAMILGVCAPALAGRKLVIEGRHVSAIAYKRVALLVSFVDPAQYEAEHLASLRADPVRFALEARILEQAVERASGSGAIVPVKALTVYPDAQALELAAAENAGRWSRVLSRLGTKRECVVHVYVGPHVAPGGEPFVARVSARSSRSGRAPAIRGDERVVAHAAKLWQSCSEAAIASRRVRSSPERNALWTASFLVNESDVEAFELLVERSSEKGAPCGVTAHFEGPRLPYSFV
jgi:hypothetical protein